MRSSSTISWQCSPSCSILVTSSRRMASAVGLGAGVGWSSAMQSSYAGVPESQPKGRRALGPGHSIAKHVPYDALAVLERAWWKTDCERSGRIAEVAYFLM